MYVSWWWLGEENDIKISLESAKKMDDAFINYSGVTILGNQDSIYYFSLFLDNDFFALIEKMEKLFFDQ